MGFWELYMNFKKDIANIVDFWDFSYVNTYNNTPISLKNIYWDDVMHASPYYGKLMLTKITGSDSNFGMKIDKKNVKDATKEQTLLIENFIKDNRNLVNKYMKNKPEDFYKVIKYEYFY